MAGAVLRVSPAKVGPAVVMRGVLARVSLWRSGGKLALAPRAPGAPGVRLRVGVAMAMASGFVNGMAAIGGIAAAVRLSSAHIAPAVMRAMMVALFLFTDP